MSREYVPSTPKWRLTTPFRYANLDMPRRCLLVRPTNRIGQGRPKSLRNIPCESLQLDKSSHHAQALALEDLTIFTSDEMKQHVVMLLRDRLPELAAYGEVDFGLNNNIWTVDISSSRFPSPLQVPASIAGCPVCIYGGKMNHPDYQYSGILPWWRPDLYTKEEVDLKQHVPEEAVWLIAKRFPRSIGFRVFVYKSNGGALASSTFCTPASNT